MKMFKKRDASNNYDNNLLVEEIKMTRQALYNAYSNLDYVTDPDLIDCCIYRLNSEQKRYKYLLEKAKESEVSTSIF